LQINSTGAQVGCETTTVSGLVEFVMSTTLHTLPLMVLRQLASHVAPQAGLRRTASRADVARCLLDSDDGMDPELKAAMLAKIDAISAARMKKAEARAAQAEAEGVDCPDGGDSDENPEGAANVPSVLEALAPGELAFVLGKGPAEKAITEEEADDIPDPEEADDPMPAKKQRVEAEVVVQAACASAECEAEVVVRAACASAECEAASWPDAIGEVATQPVGAEVPAGRPNWPKAPRLDELVAPLGCTLRQYIKPETGKMFYEAKLPQGVLFEGRNSRCPGVGPGLRGEAEAKAIASAFLHRAKDAGAF
jgi:hypothetical protein